MERSKLSRSTAAAVIVFWGLAATPAVLAQSESPDVVAIKNELRELRTLLKEQTDNESALKGRVAMLESQLIEERRANEERIRKLEDAAPASGSDLEAALKSLESYDVSPAAKSRLAISGYFDIEFRSDQAERNPTFDQHRFVLRLDGDVSENIFFKSEVEFEGGGVASRLTNNEILVEFAEVHFDFHDSFKFKAGILLVPFGRLNALHDSPLQELTDRPLVDQHIVPTTWQEAGIGGYGAFDVGPVGIDYDVILVNGLDDDFSTTAGGGFRGNRSSFRRDNNDDLMFVGRLGITPEIAFLDALNVGFSFLSGEYDDANKEDITMIGLDWTIRKGPFEVVGEFATANLERSAAQIAGGVPGGADGWYIQLNYHFFPESWIGSWDFFTKESMFTLVFRYGTIDTDDSAKAIDRTTRGDAYRDDVEHFTVGVNFRPIKKTVIKLEYQFLVEPNGVEDADNDKLVISIATYF